jgi:nitroreductase
MKSTLEDLKNRRSIRRYKPEQLAASELDAILEAGAYAPSGMGAQSAVMVATQDKALIEKLEQLNARILNDPSAKPFYGAPTVVTVLVDKSAVTPIQDGVLAMGNLMNAAHALGIGSCWIARAKEALETEEGRAILREWGLGDGYEAVAHCILGYAAETPAPRPRTAGRIISI